MVRKLEILKQDIAKVDALMYAIEVAYLDITPIPKDREKAERASDAFYLLWDAVNKVAAGIDELRADSAGLNVIRDVP